MSDPIQPLRGVVRGRMIELEMSPGLAEGQQVVVSLRPWWSSHAETIWQTAGAWCDEAESLDGMLAELRTLRRMDRVDSDPR